MHRNAQSVWMVAHGDVYDATGFLDKHPAGNLSLNPHSVHLPLDIVAQVRKLFFASQVVIRQKALIFILKRLALCGKSSSPRFHSPLPFPPRPSNALPGTKSER